jgi:hypothetical protein
MQMLVQEIERAHAMDLVWAGEKLDLARVGWQAKLPGV